MKRKPILALLTISLALMLFSPLIIQACYFPWFRPRIDPIVSTHWLNANLDNERLVILDVRTLDEYNLGHIPGAIHSPGIYNWAIGAPFVDPPPWLEVPPTDDLVASLEAHGITKYSWVVVVGNTAGPMPPNAPFPLGFFNIADITRVAMTLVYAGVRNVAILDGGWQAWLDDYPDVWDTEVPSITPSTYDGTVKEWMIVDTAYVENRPCRSVLIDARDEIVYNGEMVEPWAPNSPGHIEGARNLPAPTLWVPEFDADGNLASATYQDIRTLREMAREVIGGRWFGWRWLCCYRREIIIYCGVGGYASTVFFVLSEVLGYRNVKVYDGSMQAWDMAGNPTTDQ